jgi:hypothetical protein
MLPSPKTADPSEIIAIVLPRQVKSKDAFLSLTISLQTWATPGV